MARRMAFFSRAFLGPAGNKGMVGGPGIFDFRVSRLTDVEDPDDIVPVLPLDRDIFPDQVLPFCVPGGSVNQVGPLAHQKLARVEVAPLDEEVVVGHLDGF